MHVVMVTNTFTPHVGGVARSVEAFSAEYRRQGHRVLVIAPEFEGLPDDEPDVLRVPALQKFNGSDFSVRLPVPRSFSSVLNGFQPDVVHSHHPFLLGGTAVRIAARRNLPLVFTHHTMYEQYTHYVPGDSPALQRFVVDLATGYANLCDALIAPSDSIAAVLRGRGVQPPIEVIPTGVDAEHFARGDGTKLRRRLDLPDGAFVVGHLGRLAKEKNLTFLARAVADFLAQAPEAHFVVAGKGPCEAEIRDLFEERNLGDRLHLVGVLQGQGLVDAYHAMDVFAFASQSETQGMVLTEAMAAGVPVVAVDAPGVREVVVDRQNGRLLPVEDVGLFAEALQWVRGLPETERTSLHERALRTADQFSMPRCAARAVALYRRLVDSELTRKEPENSFWDKALRRWEAEWELWSTRAHAAGAALQDGSRRSRIPGVQWLQRLWQRPQAPP